MKINKKRILILTVTKPDSDIFYYDWIKRGYSVSIAFKDVSKPLRAIRRVWTKCNLPFYSLWLGNWYKQLNDYDYVIIHMSSITRFLPFIITKANPKLKIMCWYWNTIDKDTLPIKTDNSNIEYWSFDKNDCEKYGLNYNVQYYCQPDDDLLKKEKDIDVYFVGREKGRKEIIENFKEECLKQHLRCDFSIIKDDSNEIIPYKEVKEKLSRSKAVLEINKENQVGLTLRALESLFFDIKLITNNELISAQDIYNKHNIFVINKDDISYLKEFINNDYANRDEIKEKYELDKWIANFIKE